MYLEQFTKERDEALLSLDEEKIRAAFRKFNNCELPTDPLIFWAAIHKVITGNLGLPKEFRQKSKDYLTEHNLRSFDDGDLA